MLDTVAADAREVWRGLGAEGALDEPELGELIADLDRRLPLGVVLSVVVQVASVPTKLLVVASVGSPAVTRVPTARCWSTL